MKELLEKKSGVMDPGCNVWYRHLANCIAFETCPYCGEDIFVNEEVLERTLRKSYFYECSACPWKSS